MSSLLHRTALASITIVMIGALAYQAVNFRALIGETPNAYHAKDSRAIKSAPHDIDKLAAIFGHPPLESLPAKEIHESSLSIKLVASYISGSNDNSAAVLTKNGLEQKLYFPGDQIAPGVTLLEIDAKRVLIQRDRVIERISLRSNTDTPQFSNNDQNASAKVTHQVGITSIVDGGSQLESMLQALRKSSLRD